MSGLRLELSIPGKNISGKGLGEEPGACPDLVLNLRSPGRTVTEFARLFDGAERKSFEDCCCLKNGDTAEFYLSGRFLSRKISGLCRDILSRRDVFDGLLSLEKIPVRKTGKKDFLVFYALSRCACSERSGDPGVLGEQEETLEELFDSSISARTLTALLLSGQEHLFEEKTGAGETICFYVKSGNLARHAAELFYIVERETEGNVPEALAVCTGAYLKTTVTEVSCET